MIFEARFALLTGVAATALLPAVPALAQDADVQRAYLGVRP